MSLDIPFILQVAWVSAAHGPAYPELHPNGSRQAAFNAVADSVVALVTLLAMLLGLSAISAYPPLELFPVY